MYSSVKVFSKNEIEFSKSINSRKKYVLLGFLPATSTWSVNGLTWLCIPISKCGLYGCFMHSRGLYLCKLVKPTVISLNNFGIIILKKK